MTRTDDYLYSLLPSLHRMRDEVRDGPLRQLLQVVGEQVNAIEEDIERLYDNWFIETCDDWVVPYLGDLVGYHPLNDAGLGSGLDPTSPSSRRRIRLLVPRRDVADTIANRRRKGTVALLEELAAGSAGWPARVVEFYRLLGWTQHLDHKRTDRARTADVREGARLDRIDSPRGGFDDLARTIDIRRPVSHRTRGRYTVANAGVFVWRLGAYPVTGTPAHCIEREGSHCFTFSVLGNDAPLFITPTPEPGPGHMAEGTNVPAPLRRRAFEHRLGEHPLRADASTTYYGTGRSLVVVVQDWPSRGRSGLVPAGSVIPADLSDWHAYRAPRGKVLIDPERGRLVFPPGQLPRRVSVNYRYGFSADMGGGEYRRRLAEPVGAPVYRVRQRDRASGEFASIGRAWAKWRQDLAHRSGEAADQPRAVVIEVEDSAVYEERLVLDLQPGEYVQVRAASGCRPVLRLLDYRVDQPDALRVSGGAGARFVLDGFLVTGRGLLVSGHSQGHDDPDEEDDNEERPEGAGPDDEGHGNEGADGMPGGDLCDVTVRHCTLVPGWDLECDCSPGRPDEPSITLDRTRASLVVEHSIVGSLVVGADERQTDPVAITISDSIIDSTGPEQVAVSDEAGRIAFAHLTLARCTVVGDVLVHAADLIENSILTDTLLVARRQIGCVRYSYLAAGSRTPRRYHCQPDAAVAAAGEEVRRAAEVAAAAGTPVPAAELAARVAAAGSLAAERVHPSFTSLRYGVPGYGQLADPAPEEIWRGADDEAELGAFHDLYQPQRAANLRARLDEYTPAGSETGIYFIT